MKQKRKIIVAGILILIIACGIYYLTADDRNKTDSGEAARFAKKESIFKKEVNL